MDKDLMDWVQLYASQHGKTVTQIIKEHFRELRRQNSRLHRVDVEQI